MIKLDFPTHTVTVQKLQEADNLGVLIKAKGDADMRDVGPVYINHALVDRIAELEAQLAGFGDHAQKLATFAAYEAPPLATEADGFICEMASQYGAEMINDDGTAYAFNEEQLLAYTKANRAPNAALEAQLAAVGAGGITAGVPLMGEGENYDVRSIMLSIQPGSDGMGVEVYAKNVAEVEAVLTKQGEQIENYELGITVAAPVADLAADGDLFRRMVAAIQDDGEAFAERVGALRGDEPPTLAEFRQMLREALGDPVEPFDPELMFAEFSVPAAARSDKLARYLWGLLELSARYGFDIAPDDHCTAEIYPNEKRGKHSEAYNDIVIRDWWCK